MFNVIVLVTLIAIFLIFLCTLYYFKAMSSSKKFSKDYFALKQTTYSLTLQQAKEEAMPLLLNKDKFQCVENLNALNPIIDNLAPALSELFSRYESIETVLGEARISRSELNWYEQDDRFIVIGTDSAHVELITKPGKEALYEVDGTEESDGDITEDAYPSVYHWILMTDRILYDNYLGRNRM